MRKLFGRLGCSVHSIEFRLIVWAKTRQRRLKYAKRNNDENDANKCVCIAKYGSNMQNMLTENARMLANFTKTKYTKYADLYRAMFDDQRIRKRKHLIHIVCERCVDVCMRHSMGQTRYVCGTWILLSMDNAVVKGHLHKVAFILENIVHYTHSIQHTAHRIM